MNLFKTILLLFPFCVLACKGEDTVSPSEKQQLFFNGKIYTVNTEQPWAEAMLVNDEGVIIYIGSDEGAKNLAKTNAEQIDLNGQFVMPGIHDVHMHPLEAGSDNFQFTLNENETNPEKYSASIISALNQNPNTPWVLGWGFDIYTLLEASRSPIEILDDISRDRPIAVMELTSHSIWCNSKALELAGITASSPNPVGGIIMKDEVGEPNGILIDNAGNLLIDLAISAIATSEQNDYNGLINFSLPELAKHGITSICDARTYWKRNHHLTWQRVEREGKLTARVNLGLWAYPTEDDVSQLGVLKSLYSNDQNSLLKINQIKLYSDGIIINTTSAMHDDFKFDLFGMPTNNGLNYFTESRIAAYISELEETGFDFHIHTIGDRGISEALNAIEQSGTSKGRHRLTHVEFVNPSDYNRFNQLNVTADCQVAGDFTDPSQWHENDDFINSSLSDNVIPIKSLASANARITLSSDWDVSSVNPFVGLQNAVTRVPQELSLEAAIAAYTIDAAYVMRQENLVGSLEEGKEADFVVLSQNVFKIPTNQISSTKIESTYLKGVLIYEK